MQLYVEVGVTGRSETSAVAVAHGPGANHSRFEADRSVPSSADLQELNCASLRIQRRASWTQRHFSSSSYLYWFSAVAVFMAGGVGSSLLFRWPTGLTVYLGPCRLAMAAGPLLSFDDEPGAYPPGRSSARRDQGRRPHPRGTCRLFRPIGRPTSSRWAGST